MTKCKFDGGAIVLHRNQYIFGQNAYAMQYYTWYLVSEVSQLPILDLGSDEAGHPLKEVDPAWSTLLLCDKIAGIQAGFYDPNEQVLYRHNEEYDTDNECYHWVYEPLPGATHFMVVLYPEGTADYAPPRPITA